jgi:hypothetical protein
MDEKLTGCGSATTRMVYEYIRKRVSVTYSEVIFACCERGVDEESAHRIIDFLLVSGKIYEPKSGFLEFVDY